MNMSKILTPIALMAGDFLYGRGSRGGDENGSDESISTTLNKIVTRLNRLSWLVLFGFCAIFLSLWLVTN